MSVQQNLKASSDGSTTSESLEYVSWMSNKEGEDTGLQMEFGEFDYSDDGTDDEGNEFQYFDSDEEFESDVTLDEDGDLPKVRRINEKVQAAETKEDIQNPQDTISSALVPVDNDPYNVDSDEEKELLRGIKDEINSMVRAEMQEELSAYDHRVKAIDEGRLPSALGKEDAETDKYPDLTGMEPELREAYIKMRKLDRILEKKMKREREVKRDRILLERRIREEITNLQKNGHVQRDIKANTDKYIALCLPPSHNEGVDVDTKPVTPVFQTQLNEQEFKENHPNQDKGMASSRSAQSDSKESFSTSNSTTDRSHDGKQSTRQSRRKNKRKDFIKRNKELASNANDIIAMTDDEKKRLQELLGDLSDLPDITEEDPNKSIDDNPYQLMLRPGEGFQPSDTELRTLTDIDRQLQSILPEEDFRSIASSSLSTVTQKRLFTRVGVHTDSELESYGERALMETKEEREVLARLKKIEEQLATFHNKDEIQLETPSLTERQLESLLDQCVRSMSRISMPTETPESLDSARTLESARMQLMENPPKLSEEVLQKLLSEAHFPLSAQLLALQDDDSKSAQGEKGETIRAETWKAIAEESLDEDEESEDVKVENIKQINTSSVRTSRSDTNVHSVHSRQILFRRSGSQASDSSDRCESRVSLPEISPSPFLINMPQGGVTGGANNAPYVHHSGHFGMQSSNSLDMVFNDLRSGTVGLSCDDPVLSGTPLVVEDVSDFGLNSPVPYPPSERKSAPNIKSRISPTIKNSHT